MSEALFAAIRSACSTSLWSQAVQLSRRDSVTGDQSSDTEVTFRVLDPERGIGHRVHLYPEDEDWQCNCGGAIDPCVHVAAALIAWKQSKQRGQSLPTSKRSSGRLQYEFTEEVVGAGLELNLKRRIVFPDSTEPKPLSGFLSGQNSSTQDLTPSQLDWEVDVYLLRHLRAHKDWQYWQKLIKILKRLEHPVLFGNEEASVDDQPRGYKISITSEPGGSRLRVAQDPFIVKVFKNGLVLLKGNKVHPLLDGIEQIAGVLRVSKSRLLEDGGLFFPSRREAELNGELLPKLKDYAVVDSETTTQLDRSIKARVDLCINILPNGFEMNPTLVYGDPVRARVDEAGRFTASGDQIPQRDIDLERRLRDELWQDLKLDLNRHYVHTGFHAVSAAEKLRLGGMGWRDELRPIASFRVVGTLTPKVSAGDHRFDVEFSSEHAPGESIASKAVLTAWLQGDGLVPLTGGGLARIPTDWMQKYGRLLQDLMLARKKDGSLPATATGTVVMAAEALDVDLPLAWRKLSSALAGETQPHSDEEKIAEVQADLRPYQTIGARWLARRKAMGFGALLADDMGLGKTLQAITSMEVPSLVVAPASVLENWRRELERFRPELKVALYHGAQRSLEPLQDVTLTSYGTLRVDVSRLSEIPWAVVILDESQTIKNPDSKIAKAVFKLQARFRLALSGTPVENRLEDLWSQFRFINPGLLGTIKAFRELFAKPITEGDEAAQQALARKTQPFILRRIKADVAPELPPKSYRVLGFTLNESERNFYDALALTTRKDVLAKFSESDSMFSVLEALLRLRQTCSHPGLVPGAPAELMQPSTKIELLTNQLTQLSLQGQKALVFSQWTSFLDLLGSELDREKVVHLRIDGKVKNRQEVVDRFQTDPAAAILLISLKAGGVGLNLTAADHVYICDPWWNPAAEDQAVDRAYRIGQTKPVLVHQLVAKHTIEERLLALQDKKRALSAGLDGTQTAGGISKDELLDLLE